MSEFLGNLKFQALREFLKDYGITDLPDIADLVYIRAARKPSITSFDSSLKNIELIAKAIGMLLSKDQGNHLCAGYGRRRSEIPGSTGKTICYFPSSSSRLLRSHEWSHLMRVMGDTLTLFILTECLVVQVVGNSHVFLAGNFRSISGAAEEKKDNSIDRSMIFRKQVAKVGFCSATAMKYVFKGQDSEKYKMIQEDVRGVLKGIERRWQKLPTCAIFRSYFKDELAVKDRANVLECSVKPSRLVDFLFLISKKLFGDVFDLHGFRVLKSKLSLIVHRNRYETVSKGELVKYFRISCLRFFRVQRCTRNEFLFRFRIVSRFLVYIAETLVIPIISKYFYSTETSFSKFKVHYFPRPSWQHFSAIHIEKFLEKFVAVEDPKPSFYSELRCIPKASGARIISNMSKARNGRPSINKSIYPEFCILRKETRGELGNSILNHSGIYERLVPYLISSSKPLYILKADLTRCFDNIPQDEVVRMIRGLLSKNRYYTKSFSMLEEVNGELKTRSVYRASEGTEPIGELTKGLGAFGNRIVKENANQRILSREEVEGAMVNMVKRNYVKNSGRFFVQKTGLAQGSVASTLLCSLYYKAIDDLYFSEVFKEGVLTRYVDDFLVVSPSVDEVMKFLEVSQSISHLGLNFNNDKMESNFGLEKYLEEAPNIHGLVRRRHSMEITDQPVLWCGIKIYSRGFSIKSCIMDPYFPFSTTHCSTNPGRALESRMRNLLRNRISRLYINPSNRKVYENIYDTFLFCGKKLALLLGRMDFVNRLFAKRILENSKSIVRRACRERGVLISRKKIESMASKAFSQSGVGNIVSPP